MQGMNDVSVELLPALVALLETASVTQAAQRLHVGQPAMSRTLEKLREALGDELLVREGRGLVRTRHAERLLPQASELLVTARRVLRPPEAFDPATASGVVTLALGDDMQAMLCADLLSRVRAQAPGLDVRVRPLTLESARAAQRGEIDVAVLPDIRAEVGMPDMGELVLSPQYTRHFITVSRKRRRWTPQRFAAAEHVLVSPRGEEGGYVDDGLRALGLTRRVAMTVPSFLAAVALVERTDLVSTLPDDVVRHLGPHLHAQRCPVETPELPMCVAWARRFTRDARHRWLRGHLIDALRGLRKAG